MIATTSKQQQLLLDVRHTVLRATPEQFEQLCARNPDLRLELTKDGELIVMAPAGGETGEKNAGLIVQVGQWNQRRKLGRVFDSSTGYDFTESGGGIISPDVSWIEKSRLAGVSIAKFIPIVPDFIIELRSASDRLKDVRNKLLEYQRLGVQMGLLVNPKKCQVEIYRPGRAVELLDRPRSVNCNEVMPGFTLNLVEAGIWSELSSDAMEHQEPIELVIIFGQLRRKLGYLTPKNQARIRVLAPEQLLKLGDVLLDFTNQQDLETWLAENP